MKDFLKKILGRSIIKNIRKLFPSKVQREVNRREAADIKYRSIFYTEFIQKDDLCFDVGANFGNRISPLLALGARVVAIEPQESCYSYLKIKFRNKIELVTKGLGADETLKEFHISSGAPMSSFSTDWINSVKDGRFKDYTWSEPVLTEMTTLNKLITEYGVPAFIKIDVEGYELEVLKGLTQPVKMICFEYTVPEQTQQTIKCLEQIEASNTNIECNYSVSESMFFAKGTWLPASEMKKHLLSDEFIATGFGDIYVRTKI